MKGAFLFLKNIIMIMMFLKEQHFDFNDHHDSDDDVVLMADDERNS